MSSSPVSDTGRLAAIVAGLEDVDAQIRMLEGERRLLLARAMEHARDRMDRGDPRRRPRELEVRSVAAEIGIALHQSDRTVQRHLDEAATLLDRFPRTLSRLMTGLISPAHATAITDAGCVIADDTERAAFERVALARAERDTPARTRVFARELAERLHPESITTRHRRAIDQRGVRVVDIDDGMAELRILLAATEAHAIHDRLTQQAHLICAAARDAAREAAREAEARAEEHGRARDTGDPEPVLTDPVLTDTRTLDQIRADTATDILLTGTPTIDPTDSDGTLGAIRARVEITVPVTTLTATGDRGASIIGTSPIDADTARRLAADAPGLDRVMTHPITGTVLAVDRYRPTEAMRRFLAARDRHCRFPGCRQPTRLCHLDHNTEHHTGGPTTVTNLAHLCPRHHTLKTDTPWTVAQHTDGTLVFTSPLQRTRTEPPPPRIVFTPDTGPPPF